MNTQKAEKLKENGIHVPVDLWPYVEGYLERREQDSQRMHNFLNMSDYRSIDSVAHRIKGNGESYGFSTFSFCATQIQQAVQSHDKINIEETLVSLDREIKKVKSLIL